MKSNKQLTEALSTINSKRNALIKKYQGFIDNLQWHIDNNTPIQAEVDKCRARINDYIAVIGDLKYLYILRQESSTAIEVWVK